MVTYDPDVLRWGLHELVEGIIEAPNLAITNSGSGQDSSQMSNITENEFVQSGESFCLQKYNAVKNDEVIAHALQEELSQLALKEARNGPSKTLEDPSYASVLTQDWVGAKSLPSTDQVGEMAQNVDYDSSTNNVTESDKDSDEESVPTLLEEFSALDGEVGKRLTHMDSIPHIPRINKDLLTLDDATADYQRLADRLKQFGLNELKMDGDGNCQFRAFSDQLYRTPDHHKHIREQVVDQLKSHPDLYEGYVPMEYSDYVKRMAKSGEWGDHVTLQAAADRYGVKICLLTSFKDTWFVEILPRQPNSNRVVFLSFWAEVHYNSIYPEGDIPSCYRYKKRHRWRKLFKPKR